MMKDLFVVYLIVCWISLCAWCTPFEEEIRRACKSVWYFSLGGLVALLVTMLINYIGG